jgi:hypothetical protein
MGSLLIYTRQRLEDIAPNNPISEELAARRDGIVGRPPARRRVQPAVSSAPADEQRRSCACGIG